MSKKEIQKTIRDFLSAINDSSFTDSDNLFALGIIDSLQIMEVITFIEDTYHVTIDDAEVTSDNFSTINAISDLITRLSK